MTESASLYAPFLGLGTLLSLVLAAYGWRRRRLVPGGAAFSVFNLGVAVWTGVYIVELNATGPAAVFWANTAFLGIVLVPASWLVFALRYSGHGARVTRRFLALLFVEPMATVVLAWTNPWHHWFRRGEQVEPTWAPGPAFWVHAAYSYALVLVGTVLIARRARAGPERGPATALLVAAFAPWMANALYLSGLSPFGNLDLSPFGFGLTSFAMALVLFRDLEQRLSAAERRFRAVIDHAIDAIEIIDPETGRFLDVNERACTARGYRREEYLALRAPELDSASARRPWKEIRDEARRLGSYVFESEHRRKDGSVFAVEVNATYVSLDRDYVLAVVRDITERKKAEERQARLSRVVDQTSDSIVITDPEGTIVYVNPAFERITGYARDEVLGQNPRILKSGTQDAAFYRRMWETLARGEVWTGRLVNRRKDGTLFEEDATISPVRDAPGRSSTTWPSSATSPTRRASSSSCVQAQKMEAVGRLAGGVAHDFNNLLTVILGYGEIVLRGAWPATIRSRRRSSRSCKAAERAAGLTRQLLAFSRKQVLQPRSSTSTTWSPNMETMLRRLIGEDVELTTILAPDLGQRQGRPRADRAGPHEPGGQRPGRDARRRAAHLIETAQRRSRRRVRCDAHVEARPGPYVDARGERHGIGMDAATQPASSSRSSPPRRWARAPGSASPPSTASSSRAAATSGVYSEVGVGTTFKVYLPRVDEDAPSARATPSPVPLARGQETILLIEDEPSLRELLRETLEGGGYTVLVGQGR